MTPALSLVLPCYNEADRLPRALGALLAELPESSEVLVVDDGSDDGTAQVAWRAAEADPRVRLLAAGRNRGKGWAVRCGMLAALGDRIAFTDADGSYPPESVLRVVAGLDQAPVAIACRRQDDETWPPLRRLLSRAYNRCMRALLGLPFNDTQSGLKAFRREAARQVFGRARLDGYAFDAEALFLAGRLGLRVVEVEVRALERAGSKVHLAKDALLMLRDMLRVRRAAARGAYDGPPVLPEEVR